VKEYARKNGLQIVNAKNKLLVTVTKNDVKLGAQKNSECCAIARAVMKQQSHISRVWIFKSKAYIESPMKLTRYNLPSSVQKEIVSFDRFKIMEPGVYALVPPPPSQAPKAIAKRYESAKKSAGGGRPRGSKPRHRRVVTGVRTGVRETTA
jgi:hypothetical protein